MVQREVADRLAAQPGSRDYGLLSATAQLHAHVETLFTLPPMAFSPPPGRPLHRAAARLRAALPRAPAWIRAGFDSFLKASFRAVAQDPRQQPPAPLATPQNPSAPPGPQRFPRRPAPSRSPSSRWPSSIARSLRALSRRFLRRRRPNFCSDFYLRPAGAELDGAGALTSRRGGGDGGGGEGGGEKCGCGGGV